MPFQALGIQQKFLPPRNSHLEDSNTPGIGAGKMVPEFSIVPSLEEDLSSVPITKVRQPGTLGRDVLFWLLRVATCVHVRTFMGKDPQVHMEHEASTRYTRACLRKS